MQKQTSVLTCLNSSSNIIKNTRGLFILAEAWWQWEMARHPAWWSKAPYYSTNCFHIISSYIHLQQQICPDESPSQKTLPATCLADKASLLTAPHPPYFPTRLVSLKVCFRSSFQNTFFEMITCLCDPMQNMSRVQTVHGIHHFHNNMTVIPNIWSHSTVLNVSQGRPRESHNAVRACLRAAVW